LVVILIVIAFSGLAVFFLPLQHPPVLSLNNTKLALKQATKASALRYSEPTYRLAQELLQKGWMEMARQNGRLAPFRNYKAADSLLNLATQMAQQATRQAQEKVSYLDSVAQSERAELQNELQLCREALDGGSWANFRAERYWSIADLSLKTSKLLLNQGEYEEARQTAEKGRQSLHQLIELLAEYANDEAKKIQVWRRWVQETLNESQTNGTYALIVDKAAHKTYLIRAGEVVHVYKCELGYNSAHQKLFSGDGATPEGKYRISKIKRASKFYQALLIDYPNPTDRNRFSENKRKGIISPYARIGGLIEIHGSGGQNRDWTDGCVALTDKEMDHIMQYVTVGTPVTIVRRSDRWP
jgi:L,D-peptidoglycan transpeptidase YkuD (ErfK/YbiS/YcfS/YnhG family)